jgi:hypothetical protein
MPKVGKRRYFCVAKLEQDKSALENQHIDWMAVLSIIELKVTRADWLEGLAPCR